MSAVIFNIILLSLLAAGTDGQCAAHKHTEHETLLTPIFFKSYEVKDKNFTYYVAVCSQATPKDCNSNSNLVNAAVVQKDKKKNCYNLGKNSSVQIAKSEDWLELLYTQGDTYQHHCNGLKRKTRIMFVCNPDVKGHGKPIFLEENREDQECSYLFEWSTDLVCSSRSSKGLSIGSIVLIVVFSVAVAYLLLGFLYKRFVVGAKGIEQTPNLEFWKKVGVLSADGCDFVCRCADRVQPVEYKLNDNQLQLDDDDDDDDEKDDTLLPM